MNDIALDLKACKRCGVNHEYPGSDRRAAIVLACALGGEFDFSTREGPIAKPHREAGIA